MEMSVSKCVIHMCSTICSWVFVIFAHLLSARPAAASIVAVVGALLSRQLVQAGSLLPWQVGCIHFVEAAGCFLFLWAFVYPQIQWVIIMFTIKMST